MAEIGEPDSTLEDLENDWAMEGFDPASDAWVAGGPRGLVGYAYAGDQFRTGELEADLWVHPEHHEPELGGPPARARRAPGGRRSPSSAATSTPGSTSSAWPPTAPSATCCAGTATSSTRTVYRMTVDLGGDRAGGARARGPRDPDLPARGPTSARCSPPCTTAFADHYRRSDEPFEAWKTRLLGHPNFVPELWWLAWDDAAARPPARVIAYDHGDLGWVQGLGVRRPWRRRGLGAALLAHVLAAFKARGQLRVDLGVDAEGATRPLRLYERAGMQASAAYELYARRLV